MKKIIAPGGFAFLVLLAGLACRKTNDSLAGEELAVTALTPASGPSGTAVAVAGKGFSLILAEDTVLFNGVPAQIVSSSDTSISVLAPQGGSTGTVRVIVRDHSADGPAFTYTTPPPPATPKPVIQSVGASDNFTVTGTNFDPTASVVTLDGRTIGGFTYADNGNGTESLRTPYNGLPGDLGNPVQVVVAVNGVASDPYSFLFDPVIVSASPDTVTQGQTLTLQGKFFGNQQGSSSVSATAVYGSVTEGLSAPAVQSWGTNSVKLTVPNYDANAGNEWFVLRIQISVGGKAATIDLTYKHS